MRLKDQLQKRPVAGAIAIVSFFIVQSLLTILFDEMLGPVKCNDGYASPSIGRSGACSSHGGVDRSRDALIALLSVAGAADRRAPYEYGTRASPPSLGPEMTLSALRKKRGGGRAGVDPVGRPGRPLKWARSSNSSECVPAAPPSGCCDELHGRLYAQDRLPGAARRRPLRFPLTRI